MTKERPAAIMASTGARIYAQGATISSHSGVAAHATDPMSFIDLEGAKITGQIIANNLAEISAKFADIQIPPDVLDKVSDMAAQGNRYGAIRCLREWGAKTFQNGPQLQSWLDMAEKILTRL